MTRDSASGFQVLVNTTAFCAEPITVTKGVYSCFDDGKLVDFDNTNYTQSWVYVNVASHDENSVELDLIEFQSSFKELLSPKPLPDLFSLRKQS